MILRIIDEIDHCLEKDFHLAALALALTLPDACGKAAYPTENHSSKRYIDWYENYIGQYERDRNQSGCADLADRPFLSGELVYQLRCSFLHSGDTDVDINRIKEKQNQLTQFNLVLRRHDDILAAGTSSLLTYGENGSVEGREFDVSITYLCKILESNAKKYYEDNKDKFDFFSYNIVDNM